jgi:hypothetical protein
MPTARQPGSAGDLVRMHLDLEASSDMWGAAGFCRSMPQEAICRDRDALREHIWVHFRAMP